MGWIARRVKWNYFNLKGVVGKYIFYKQYYNHYLHLLCDLNIILNTFPWINSAKQNVRELRSSAARGSTEDHLSQIAISQHPSESSTPRLYYNMAPTARLLALWHRSRLQLAAEFSSMGHQVTTSCTWDLRCWQYYNINTVVWYVVGIMRCRFLSAVRCTACNFSNVHIELFLCFQ